MIRNLEFNSAVKGLNLGIITLLCLFFVGICTTFANPDGAGIEGIIAIIGIFGTIITFCIFFMYLFYEPWQKIEIKDGCIIVSRSGKKRPAIKKVSADKISIIVSRSIFDRVFGSGTITLKAEKGWGSKTITLPSMKNFQGVTADILLSVQNDPKIKEIHD